MEKREPSYTIGRNLNWYSHYGKQYGGSLNRVTMWSSNPTPWYISGENSNSKNYTHIYIHSGTIYNSQDMEAT